MFGKGNIFDQLSYADKGRIPFSKRYRRSLQRVNFEYGII